MVEGGLSCLKESMEKDGLTNIYTNALMAYAFTLAQDLETRNRLLDQLHKDAKTKGQSLLREVGGA